MCILTCFLALRTILLRCTNLFGVDDELTMSVGLYDALNVPLTLGGPLPASWEVQARPKVAKKMQHKMSARARQEIRVMARMAVEHTRLLGSTMP